VREWGGFLALAVALVGSLSLNVHQGWRLRALTAVQAKSGIKIGGVLPEISARSVDGRHVVIGYPRPSVVYVLSPNCIWCGRNYQNVLALAAASAGRYQWVGLAIDTDAAHLRQYLAKSPLPFEVFMPEPPDLLERVNVRGTPTTLVVSAQGEIREAWVGAFMTDRLAAVNSFFDVRLPGLVAPK
jgi:hypothetical protein